MPRELPAEQEERQIRPDDRHGQDGSLREAEARAGQQVVGERVAGKSAIRPRNSSVQPNAQFTSRGLRNAPVKNTRIRWISIPATKTSAAQWWICRISSPPRTSKLMSRVDAYAFDIRTPCSGSYVPWYTSR